MTQYARPDSDLVTGNWSPSTGSSLYAVIDEETATDSDYVSVTDNYFGTAETCQVELSSVTDPDGTTDHTVLVRAYTDSYSESVTLSVVLGTSSGAIKTASFTPTTSFANYTMTLSSSEASSLSAADYADLRIQITATDSMSMGSQTRVSQVYFSCPDAPAGTTVTPDAASFVATATATVNAPITITPAAAVIECEDWIPKFIVGDKTVIRTPVSATWGVEKYYDSSYTYDGCDSRSAARTFGTTRAGDYWLTQKLTAWWFPSVDLPECYNVSNAVFKFEGVNTPYLGTNWNTNSPRVTIYGDDADDATDTDLWSCTGYNSHTLTTANETWYPPKTATSGAMEEQTTDDISSVVNEIRNRSGWEAGNNMQFFFENPLPRFSSGYTGWLVDPHINRFYGRVGPVLEITYDGSGTVKKTIGSTSTHGTSTPTSSTGSSTYTVGFDTAVTGVSVGDKVFFEDFSAGYGEEYIYRVAEINSTTNFDLTFVSGGSSGDVTPYGNLYAEDFSQASGTFKSVYDYESPRDWAADLDDTSVYCDNDNAIGEICVNEKYDQGVVFGTPSNVSLSSITLTVKEAVRHNGTADSGAGFKYTATSSSGGGANLAQIIATQNVSNLTIEWVEFDGSGVTGSSYCDSFVNDNGGTVDNHTIRNCLMHSLNLQGGNFASYAIKSSTPNTGDAASHAILNNIIYGVTPSTTSGGDAGGINANAGQSDSPIYVYNNTINGITARTSSHYARGIYATPYTVVTNNIATDVTGSSTAVCFFLTTGSWHSSSDYNLSTDTTAAGSNSVTSATLANIYVSNSGTINLHLKAGSPAIDAGYDLGTTPTGVNIDIDGRNRDTEGDTWDIGADEYFGLDVAPSAAAFEAAAVSPTAVQASLSITPAASAADADATLTGAELGSVTVTPATASAVLNGVSPTVVIPDVDVAPAAASLIANATLSGVQAGSISITPAVASLEAATVSPAVSLGSVSVTPSRAVCTAAAVSPSVIIIAPSVTVTPTGASFVAVAISPTTSSGSLTVTPTAAASALAAATPSVVQSNMTLTPSAAAITTAASATASQDSLTLTPSVASAVAPAVSPTVVRGSITVTPTAAAATTSVSYRALVFGSMVVVVPESAKAVYTSQNPSLAFGSTTANPAAASFVATASATASQDSFTITPAAAVVVTDVTSPTILAGVTATPAPAQIELSCPPITLVITFDSAALGYWVDGRPDYKVGGKVDYSIDGRPDYEIGDLL
jgi:hypothetical protein